MFAPDERVHYFVIQRQVGARVGSAHESRIVHPQRGEIVFVSQRNIFAEQNFAISFQMDALVIDDDAVEVKKDSLDHLWMRPCKLESVRSCSGNRDWLLLKQCDPPNHT